LNPAGKNDAVGFPSHYITSYTVSCASVPFPFGQNAGKGWTVLGLQHLMQSSRLQLDGNFGFVVGTEVNVGGPPAHEAMTTPHSSERANPHVRRWVFIIHHREFEP